MHLRALNHAPGVTKANMYSFFFHLWITQGRQPVTSLRSSPAGINHQVSLHAFLFCSCLPFAQPYTGDQCLLLIRTNSSYITVIDKLYIGKARQCFPHMPLKQRTALTIEFYAVLVLQLPVASVEPMHILSRIYYS